jgi:quinol-cytochrome oxidoreductase complex cytochrome b subunit
MTESSSEPERVERRSSPGWWSSRLGLPGIRAYLDRFPVPAGKGAWVQALGGALLVMLLFEACTGLLLFVYYRQELPHASVTNIVEEVRYGWLIRSLHRTGAHATVALALAHAATTFIRQRFRTPRELTWWTGGLLGLAIGAFAFTGTLLPWNQTSLYAAQVGGTLTESIPVLGGVLASILIGGETLGPLIQRAFALHVAVIPSFFLLIAALHVYLVHTHGLQGAYANPTSQPLRSFLPRAALGWLVLLNVVVVAAALAPPALEPAADLLAPSSGAARPAWYFMAVFQLARTPALGGSGATAMLALVTAGAVLAAAPWWASAAHGWRGPKSVLAVGLALALGLLALTFAGYGG